MVAAAGTARQRPAVAFYGLHIVATGKQSRPDAVALTRHYRIGESQGAEGKCIGRSKFPFAHREEVTVMAKTAAKVAAKSAAKSAAKVAAKSAAKVAAKSAAKSAAKVAAKSAAKVA
jgi:hypothetical protein